MCLSKLEDFSNENKEKRIKQIKRSEQYYRQRQKKFCKCFLVFSILRVYIENIETALNACLH